MSNSDESDSKKYLKSLIDFDSDNFFGTGLSLQEFVLSEDFKRWHNSLSRVDASERRRRLKLIRKLYLTLEAVERESGVFGTIWVDSGVEAIFNGDWKECRFSADMLLHEGEDAQIIKIYRKAHAPLRALLLEACETALPGDDEARH
jgi:hypothetical protein